MTVLPSLWKNHVAALHNETTKRLSLLRHTLTAFVKF